MFLVIKMMEKCNENEPGRNQDRVQFSEALKAFGIFIICSNRLKGRTKTVQ